MKNTTLAYPPSRGEWIAAGIDGDRLRSARRGAGLTQRDLARVLGVTINTIGNWEREGTVPSPAFRRALAEILNLGLNLEEKNNA